MPPLKCIGKTVRKERNKIKIGQNVYIRLGILCQLHGNSPYLRPDVFLKDFGDILPVTHPEINSC
jgi:hypothetical protein